MDVKLLSPKTSIRRYILVWMIGLIACFTALGAALMVSTNNLESMTARIISDSKSIELARRLEAAIISERREHTLWETTRKREHLKASRNELEKSEAIVHELPVYLTSVKERQLIDVIEKRFKKYKNSVKSDSISDNGGISLISDSLLSAVERFGEQNSRHMTDMFEASARLNELVDRWSLVIVIAASLIALFGALSLLNRIIQPTLSLAQAAMKVGRGDFTARAKSHRNDELGNLCETFNTMAEDIDTLQRDRLNFIATVAHDLKNPLIVIGAAARRLKKKNLNPEEIEKWPDRIIYQSEYLENLTSDLMDTVQIETGNLTLQMAECEIAGIVREIHQSQNELIVSHEIVIEGEGEYRVMLDARRFKRVIENLISNALKYSPSGTTVTLRVEGRGRYAAVAVIDEGVGIPHEEVDRLFKPFERLGHTMEMAPGAGLGLFSVKKIVEGHGGEINISSSPGCGTTVEILLPLIRDNGR
jgi:two-component system, OmpR family, sensor histidine kinase MtrB